MLARLAAHSAAIQADENVSFIANVALYRRSPLYVGARNIINEFVLPQSVNEINLSDTVRADTIARFNLLRDPDAPVDLFAVAENEIQGIV